MTTYVGEACALDYGNYIYAVQYPEQLYVMIDVENVLTSLAVTPSDIDKLITFLKGLQA